MKLLTYVIYLDGEVIIVILNIEFSFVEPSESIIAQGLFFTGLEPGRRYKAFQRLCVESEPDTDISGERKKKKACKKVGADLERIPTPVEEPHVPVVEAVPDKTIYQLKSFYWSGSQFL